MIFNVLFAAYALCKRFLKSLRILGIAGGLAIHRTKSKSLPNRDMSTTEKRSLNRAWADANVVKWTISLGTPIGRGVAGDEISDRGYDRISQRIEVFSQTSMSWTMRVLAVNMFLFSLVSYPNRLFLMSPERSSRLADHALRFITPVPFCSYVILSHCSKLFRTGCAPRDPLLDNIAAVLSTAYMLQRRGVIDEGQIKHVQHEIT